MKNNKSETNCIYNYFSMTAMKKNLEENEYQYRFEEVVDHKVLFISKEGELE